MKRIREPVENITKKLKLYKKESKGNQPYITERNKHLKQNICCMGLPKKTKDKKQIQQNKELVNLKKSQQILS